jgi:hypothetical protein
VARIGAGLKFSTFLPSYRFNYLETGNPGLTLKTWITLDKLDKIHIVPSVSAFSPSKRSLPTYIIQDYFFQADLDAQYALLKDMTIKLIVFAGGNYSYMSSTVSQADERYPIVRGAPTDTTGTFFGANVGTGLEMRMSSRFDMNVTIKYTYSKHPLFMISAEGVYYFRTRRKSKRISSMNR